MGIVAATAAVVLIAQLLASPEAPVVATVAAPTAVELAAESSSVTEPPAVAATETPAVASAPATATVETPAIVVAPDAAKADASGVATGVGAAPADKTAVTGEWETLEMKEPAADAKPATSTKGKAPVAAAKAGTAKTKPTAAVAKATVVAKTKAGDSKAPIGTAAAGKTAAATPKKGVKEAAVATSKPQAIKPAAGKEAAAVDTPAASVVPADAGVRKPQYWSFWGASQEASASTINHADWDRILRTYVIANHPSGINRFRYGSVNKDDRKTLKGYIERMAALDPRTFSRQEQKAYWLNLYNALTVNLVIEHYPVKSIRNIADKNLPDGPWDSKLVTIADQKVSLNDIEHRILRPIWQDNKIHFGLVGANLGCPSLIAKAFTAKNSEDLLKQSRRDFVNDSRGVKLANGKLEASELFSWYQQDFAKTDKNLIKFFAFNADDRKALYLLGFTGKIDYKTYDWALNAP